MIYAPSTSNSISIHIINIVTMKKQTSHNTRSARLMHLLFILYCLLFVPTCLDAQTFTQTLTRVKAGEGQVRLHQDEEITALVNGTSSYVAGRNTASRRPTRLFRPVSTDSILGTDTVSTGFDTPIVSGHRSRMNGFRIQVYAGGDNRKSKAEAYRTAASVRNYFAGLSVYTNFISPRWVCRVGDFRTRGEAEEMLSQLRQTGSFHEAFIVKTQIIATY